MKIELIKETDLASRTWYVVVVNGERRFFEMSLENADKKIQEIIENFKNPVKEELLKTIEL